VDTRLERLRKTTRIFSLDVRQPARDSNRLPPIERSPLHNLLGFFHRFINLAADIVSLNNLPITVTRRMFAAIEHDPVPLPIAFHPQERIPKDAF